MATINKKCEIIQKTGADEYLLLHPETTAENVLLSVDGVTATNVQAGVAELHADITGIIDAGIVTGVKGGAETTYRTGQVNVTKDNIGLGNVENLKPADMPISTAQKTAIDAKANKTYVDTELAKKADQTNMTGKLALKADKTYVDTELGKKQNAGDYATKTEVDAEIKTAINAVVGENVDTAFDTLKEIADWIKTDETKAAELTNRVGQVETDITAIKTKNTSQDTAISKAQKTADDATTAASTAQTTANKGVTDASAAKSAADSAATAASTAQSAATKAQGAADTNTANITKIVSGDTKVGNASKADTATSAGKLTTARTIALKGDVTGSTTFDGSANKDINVTLANTGVTAGTYSAVTVDTKGRVTAGGQLIEIGTTGQTAPSTNLAVGGLFFKLV